MFVSEAYAADQPATTGTAAATTTTTMVPTPDSTHGTTTGTTVPEKADIPADQPPPSPFGGMLIFLPLLLVLYFLMIRPNQKKIREFDDMVKALRRGDRIVTGGGIIGVIHKIENDDVLVIEIAEGVRVRVMRETISHVINKTAVNDNKAEGKAGDRAAGN